MPPPPTTLAFRATRLAYLATSHPGTALAARTALFALKAWTVLGACAPFAVSPPSLVSAALFLPAAADLGVPGTLVVSTSWDMRVSLALLALHYAVLWLAARAGWLCAGPAVPGADGRWQQEWQ